MYRVYYNLPEMPINFQTIFVFSSFCISLLTFWYNSSLTKEGYFYFHIFFLFFIFFSFFLMKKFCNFSSWKDVKYKTFKAIVKGAIITFAWMYACMYVCLHVYVSVYVSVLFLWFANSNWPYVVLWHIKAAIMFMPL